jgi:hypothetical protein
MPRPERLKPAISAQQDRSGRDRSRLPILHGLPYRLPKIVDHPLDILARWLQAEY